MFANVYTACSSADDVCKCLCSGDYSIGSLAGRRMQPGLSLPFSVACLEGVVAHTCSPFTLLRIKAKKARARRLCAWWGLEAPEKALGCWGLGQQALRKGCLLNRPYCDGRELVQPVAHALRFPEDTGAIYKTTELPLPCEVSISTLWVTAQCWGGGFLSLPWSLGARPGMHSVSRKPFPKETPEEQTREEGEHRGARKLHLSPLTQLTPGAVDL